MTSSTLLKLTQRLGKALQSQELVLTTAESCTGGGIAHAVTMVPGSSNWFDRGFVTYSNAAKQEMLGVSIETLSTHGAVSEETAREMLVGALKYSHASIGISVTGIAGPATDEHSGKPVGTVWFAWGGKEKGIQTSCQHFKGDREAVRYSSVCFALESILNLII